MAVASVIMTSFCSLICPPLALARALPPVRQWRLPGPEVEEILSLPENQEKTKQLIITITFDIFNGITDFISAQADVVI